MVCTDYIWDWLGSTNLDLSNYEVIPAGLAWCSALEGNRCLIGVRSELLAS